MPRTPTEIDYSKPQLHSSGTTLAPFSLNPVQAHVAPEWSEADVHRLGEPVGIWMGISSCQDRYWYCPSSLSGRMALRGALMLSVI
jgi:hypothetical protein